MMMINSLPSKVKDECEMYFRQHLSLKFDVRPYDKYYFLNCWGGTDVDHCMKKLKKVIKQAKHEKHKTNLSRIVSVLENENVKKK